MIKKVIITLLLLLAVSSFIFGVWYYTNINHWPLWIALSIILGTLGTLLGLVFLRRYILRRNERKYVKRVIAQEGDAIFASGQDSSLLINDLETQWEKAIQTLYSSKLKNGANPIYALPWILVIGESGAGKTTLIKNSRLSSAATDVEISSQYAGTKNCDWWFFKDAIILDTAGRYTVPIDEKRDNLEWERFLSLLTKYRREEPLNGMVITISAERLLENDKDIIQEDALNIRKRINQLMVSIGAKFPVYLMVTKMDHIYGFNDFARSLPEEFQSQAMGYMNESLNQHYEEVISEGIGLIQEKIKSFQLLFLQQNKKDMKELLLFSKEFDRLTPALHDFSQVVFGDNPYQKIPMLRGVYFSSALSDGEDKSQFLEAFNIPQTHAPVENKAYFITDFFKVILPNDRNIFTPIQEYLTWQKRNYKIALFAWIFLFSAVAGLYTYSYLQNINIIGDVKYVKNHTNSMTKAVLSARILLMDKLRLDIEKIDALNQKVLVPSLSFNQSRLAENNLKKLFIKDFDTYLLRSFSYKMNAAIDKIDSNTNSKEVVDYIGFMIDSMDILEQVLKANTEIKVSDNFHTWIEGILFNEDKKIDPSIAVLFVKSYIAFLKYSDDRALIKESLSIFQDRLAYIVDKKGKNLHWLTDEGVSMAPDISIGDFWQGTNVSKAKRHPTISGSLTQKGRENLLENINVLVNKIKDPTELNKNLSLFWKWYDERFYYRWKNFALNFNAGKKYLDLSVSNQNMLYSMSSDQNPYFNFIHTIASELQAYKSINKTPSWVKMVIDTDKVLGIAGDIRNAKSSIMSKVSEEKNKVIANAEQQVHDEKYIKQMKSATLFNKYVDDLKKLSIVTDKKKSQNLIEDFFNDDASKKVTSPSYSEAINDYKQFRYSLPYYENSEFIYKLLFGPQDYIINYSIKQMNIVLNKRWESMVLSTIPRYSKKNLIHLLFDKQTGVVWKYLHENMQVFIRLDKYGYTIKKVDGYKLNITASFLHYINSARDLLNAYKPEYKVSMTALPFEINKNSLLKPEYITLRLHCASKDYILENNNYKLEKEFIWSNAKCGDTLLTFGFDGFSLHKTYKGENGFLYFLKDFRSGTHTFKAKDYDAKIPEILHKNIKWVKVSYDIRGEDDILKLLDKTPYHVPKKVTVK